MHYALGMGLASLTLELERRVYVSLRSVAGRRQARRAAKTGAQAPPEHLITGERGEDAAFFHLRGLGYTIVARRWRAERLQGDLDLVGWDGDTLVVFEVKTRTARDRAPAEAEVDAHKQQVLRRMAAAYLRQIPEAYREAIPLRFDVLAVYLLDRHPGAPEAGAHNRAAATEIQFEHFRNAFPVSGPAPRRRR
jgi:putative endonuclease